MSVILWTKKARKQLIPIPAKDAGNILEAVETLANWPQVKGVRALSGRDGYRLRVGRYRVLFTVTPDGAVTVILVEEVKKRDERTC